MTVSRRTFPEGSVYCAGNMVLDILVRPVDALPPWGTTHWVDRIEQHLGGNGAITAYTLGKLDAPVRLAGAVGDDAFGAYLLDRLRAVSVDVSHVQVCTGVQTATTVGLINARSERLFLHALGASNAVAPERISFDGCSYFHFASMFQLPPLRRSAAALLGRARAQGLFTSVDTMWDPTGRWMQDFGPVCPLIDLLFANQDEARMLAGSADPALVGRFFRGRGVGIVVVKLGENGCAVYADGQEGLIPAYDVPVVDTTGAGDCFCGGFLAGLRRGLTLADAARFASAVAAHSIQQIGGADGVVGYDETLAWMADPAEARRDSVVS